MRKIEVGRSKPTENRVGNVDLSEQVNGWVNKVREAGKFVDGDGVNSSINRVADILAELILQTKRGKYPREVISGVASRVNLQASLAVVEQKMIRSK